MLNPVTEPLLMFLHWTLSACPLWSQFLYEPFPVTLDQTEAPCLCGPWLSAYPTCLKQPGMRNKAKSSLRKISNHVHSCLFGVGRKRWPLRGIASLVCPGAGCLMPSCRSLPGSSIFFQQYLMVFFEVGMI